MKIDKSGTKDNTIHLKIYTLPNCIFCKALMGEIKHLTNIKYTEYWDLPDSTYDKLEKKYNTNFYPIIEIPEIGKVLILRSNLINSKEIIIFDNINEIINYLNQL